MESLNLQIRNMVCPRCIVVIRQELTRMGVQIIDINLGNATVVLPTKVSQSAIENKLNEFGFEILKSNDEILIERIKSCINEYLNYLETDGPKLVLSDYLIEELCKNYNYLSKLFSRMEGQTIESYCIHSKINRVKQLIEYDELNLSEIALKLGYSSIQYLSSQFKKVEKISLTEFRKQIGKKSEYYLSISNAITTLKNSGFVYDFEKSSNSYLCKNLNIFYPLGELSLCEVYRFTNPLVESSKLAIFTVETNSGLKGILIDNNNNNDMAA